MTLKFNNVRPIIDSNWGIVKKKVSSKKYIIDQKPPYLMRQICVLQWEEIKTKNSEHRIICAGVGGNKNIYG